MIFIFRPLFLFSKMKSEIIEDEKKKCDSTNQSDKSGNQTNGFENEDVLDDKR